ncbi:MAG: hypothetical protein HN576_10255, partial [Bacteriovoracaceae bacterium]|nr:hypothetical protein [Bacteriovoracaceae bacterium]
MAILRYLLLTIMFALAGCNSESGNADPIAAGGGAGFTNPLTPMLVSINKKGDQEDPATSLPIEFRVTFSIAIDPAGFTKSDIDFIGSTATGIEFDLVQINHKIFYINVTSVTSQGTVVPNIAESTVMDIFGNRNLASTGDNSVYCNYTPLGVTINQVVGQADPTGILPIQFDVVFTEAIDNSTFNLLDITQSGMADVAAWTLTNPSGDRINYILAATSVTSGGSIIPTISADLIQTLDAKNNTSSQGADNTVVYTQGLIVSINQAFGQIDPAVSLPINFDVVFSEPIVPGTFTPGDITKSGTATGVIWDIQHVSGNTNFTVSVTTANAAGGTIQFTIAAGEVQTAANLNNLPSVSDDNIVTYSATPTVTINTPTPINISNQSTYGLTGSCSEAGQIVVVVVGSITSTPTCSVSLTWAATIDVSSLADGLTLSVTADHSDAASNPATQASTTVLKDTIAPTLAITAAPAISASNETTYSVVGTCSENGESVAVSIGTINLTPTCLAGAFTTGNVDVSALPDNPLLPITADHMDLAGNPAIQVAITVVKDTATPTVTI